MPEIKISQMPELLPFDSYTSEGGTAPDDYLPIIDSSETNPSLINKKVSVSTLFQNVLSLFENAALSGQPTTPTPSLGDNSLLIANTEYVQNEINNIGTLPPANEGEILTYVSGDWNAQTKIEYSTSASLTQTNFNLGDLTGVPLKRLFEIYTNAPSINLSITSNFNAYSHEILLYSRGNASTINVVVGSGTNVLIGVTSISGLTNNSIVKINLDKPQNANEVVCNIQKVEAPLAAIVAPTQSTGVAPTSTPVNGTIIVDQSGNGRIYVRVNNTWKSVALA